SPANPPVARPGRSANPVHARRGARLERLWIWLRLFLLPVWSRASSASRGLAGRAVAVRLCDGPLFPAANAREPGLASAALGPWPTLGVLAQGHAGSGRQALPDQRGIAPWRRTP